MIFDGNKKDEKDPSVYSSVLLYKPIEFLFNSSSYCASPFFILIDYYTLILFNSILSFFGFFSFPFSILYYLLLFAFILFYFGGG